MNNEFLKMQKLAGLITESQYKEKLNEISQIITLSEDIDNKTIMDKVEDIKPLFSGLNYPDSVIVNFVQTHFNDIVGFSDEEIMDEFKEFITINFEENMNEDMILEAKKLEIDKKLAEIDKEGKITTLEAKIAAIDEVIEAKNSRINMVQEDENLSELIDKKRVKEMQNEIKLLEKSKKLYKKQLDKANGKKEDKKEIVDEQSTESYQSPSTSIDYTI